MGIALQYVITAQQGSNQDAEDPPGPSAQIEQKLLGYVAKTIHDYPILSDATRIAGNRLFDDPAGPPGDHPGPGPDNQIHLALRPVTIEQNLNFWGVQNTKIARLSLFVEARVVLLEAEKPRVTPGIVLSVGQFVFTGAGPQLVSSESTVRFRPPGTPAATPDSQLPKAVANPARAAIFDQGAIVATVPAENNRLVLSGSGLGLQKRFLLLRRQGFEARVALDPPDATNGQWSFDAASSRITMRVQPTVTSEPIGAIPGGVKNIVPGIYGARLSIEVAGQKPRTSNEVAFAATPQVGTITKAGSVYTLTLAGGAYLQTEGLDIQLAVGPEVLTLVTVAPDPGHPTGEFEVTSPTTIDFTRKLTALPAPVSLVVNGASAPPIWIEV
jgi:hypothetical protein